MIADSEILTYIFLGFVAFLFAMIFWNVLGAPRKKHRERRTVDAGTAADGGFGDAGSMLGTRGRRHREDDLAGGDDGGSDGGGGDGGGGD